MNLKEAADKVISEWFIAGGYPDTPEERRLIAEAIHKLQKASAAAPQVVADEWELPPLPVCHELMPFKGYPVTEGICCYTAQQMADYARASIESAQAGKVFQPQDFGYVGDLAAAPATTQEIRAVAPVQAQEPALFFKQKCSAIWIETDSIAWLENAPPELKDTFETRVLYRAPVQPVAVPGKYWMIHECDLLGLMSSDIGAAYVDPIAAAKRCRISIYPAAPAAQGDAKEPS